MPWLSVLVPIYNVQAYLRECLTSVVEQLDDDSGVQILVLDDCSTDGSWPLMQELSQRWPGRLQLLRHERNGGLSAARNTLIEAARGDYLWFLDSDDKLLPGAIAGLRTIVHAHAPDVVLCDFSVWRERPRLKHRLRGERHRRSFNGPARRLVRGGCLLVAGMLSAGELHAWSKISRRALWGDDLRFPVGQHFEDMTTMPLMALRAESFYYEPVPWVAYRRRPGSILASMSLSKALDQSAALLPFAQALKTSPCGADPRTRFSLARQAARNLVGAMRSVCQPGAVDAPSEVAETLRRNFLETSPLTPRALARAYFWRGWWGRRHRFLRWFNARPLP
ncbi:glycosyltransferase family 2 protein [Ottowia testudinis]|uniref:Glycosyltransferase family 2 protein n=1 Tax=Ottowia testudinis TaxID=2816950 RepID=A0A975H3E9_9BURK|nr:glycosyltransferase family 2 protein [Ottowia testudinis]QTD45166.1 glycosyltransferase family 2 protein [Ottowia testudinis]